MCVGTMLGCGAGGASGGQPSGTGAVFTDGADQLDAAIDTQAGDGSGGSDALAGDSGGGAGDADAGVTDTSTDAATTDGNTKDGAAIVDSAAADVSTGCTTPCTDNQVCVAGVCVKVVKPCAGACALTEYCDAALDTCKPSACALPSSWGPTIQKMSYFAVAQSADGCDLDGDSTPDNVLGNILKLYPAVNTELDKSIQDGLFVMLLEAPEFSTDGKAFAINGLLGQVDPSNATCSMTSPWASCKFTIDDDNYSPGPAGGTCPPQVVISPATVATGGVLAAGGGTGQTITVKLPTSIPLSVKLSQVSMSGYIQGGAKWTETKKGKLCGVITQKDFSDTINAVPDSAWAELSLTKEQATLIINATLKPDIDTNADGHKDAISVAFLFETVPAVITKLTF